MTRKNLNCSKRRFNKTKTLCLFLMPLITLLIMNILNNGKITTIVSWVIYYPHIFFLNYLLLFGIINFFILLPFRIYLTSSIVIFLFFSVLGFVSHQKMTINGIPLLPSDFLLIKEAFNVSGSFSFIYFFLTIFCLIAIFMILLLLKFVPKDKYKWSSRVIIALLSLTLLFNFYFNFGFIQKAFGLQLINFSPKINYEQNGLLVGMILNTQNLNVQEPSNYGPDSIKQILDSIQANNKIQPDFKPNIIMVMSEAFWDPTLMKNVSFSEDPIPFFHSLQQTQTSGTLLSPVYGGSTANTELEALTGFSTQFLAGGVVPYAQHINRPLEALPLILKRQGYTATAIHTYDNWFYNRNKVYEKLGFDKFISKEFFNNPEYKGQYIRDTELIKMILTEIQATAKPDFIFALSMQAHGPYPSEEYPDNTINISCNTLSPSSKAILSNYVNTVHDVDKSLAQLIQGLEQIEEPTLVIFFGDHLPLLGEDYIVYKEAGFISGDNSYRDYENLHSVPFVIWDNFSTVKEYYRISSNYLSVLTLKFAQKAGGPLTDFLSGLLSEDMAVIPGPNYWNQEKILPDLLESYKLLQYDLMFGNEYVYRYQPENRPGENKSYLLGDGAAVIERVEIKDDLLLIHGKNFKEKHTVYLNNKPVKTDFIDAHNIKGVGLKNLKNTDKLEVQIKLIDSQQNVIGESNIFVIESSS